MPTWNGASKGNVLGYKIFVFCIRVFGIRSAYSLLLFVALYYVFTAWKSNKAIYRYFSVQLGYKPIKACISVYKSYFIFGQTLIDRVVVSSGHREKFTYEFDGIERIRAAIQKGNGAVLISAHVGNFELAEFFFDDLNENLVSHIVTTDSEKEQIKNYLERFSLKSSIQFILIKDDMSHIFELNAALSRNELVCITGDRYMEGNKFLEAQFLKGVARFPAGPFLIGSRLKVPVLFVYVMKESATHYHLYAREAKEFHRKEKALLENYITSMTQIIERYPNQWFNYFDFWKKEN